VGCAERLHTIRKRNAAAPAIGQFLDVHTHGIVGQERFDEFRPLDETGRTGIEIVVGADIEGFVYVLNAVEIKVEDGTVQHAAVVFVDNSEGGRIYHVINAEHVAERLDKCGFARSHLAIKGKDVAVLVIKLRGSGKLTRGFVDTID